MNTEFDIQIFISKEIYVYTSNGQYTGNTVKPRYFFHTEYNLEISQYRFML